MNLAPRFALRRGAVVGEAIDAMRAIEARGPQPIVLGYHPVARSNPFQALLYRNAWDVGLGPVGIMPEDGIDELGLLAEQGHRVVLHLHWLHHPAPAVRGLDEAQRDVDGFVARLDAFRAAGGRLVWTIHNVHSHQVQFESAEARLYEAVATRCDVVHVMTARTPELVAPYYTIPRDRLLHIPHPSYLGAYEDYITREQARHELGLMPDELVYAMVGAMRGNKGLTGLLDAWDTLPASPPRRLLLAGLPTDEAEIPRVLERAALHPRIVLWARRIAPQQMQLFLRAADVALLPYTRALNSGALMLALTFGLPVVVPAGGGLAEVVDESFAVTFDPEQPGSLSDAIVEADRLVTPEARAAAREAALDRDPDVVSRRFSEALRERLDSGS